MGLDCTVGMLPYLVGMQRFMFVSMISEPCGGQISRRLCQDISSMFHPVANVDAMTTIIYAELRRA